MKGETLSFSSRTFLGYIQRRKSEGKIAQFEVHVVHRSEDACHELELFLCFKSLCMAEDILLVCRFSRWFKSVSIIILVVVKTQGHHGINKLWFLFCS